MSLWKGISGTTVLVKDHAVTRMMERNIFKSDILSVLYDGEVLEDYPTDFPYPSCLMFKIVDSRPIHIVAAYNVTDKQIIVVTAYIPDTSTFESDFKTRKRKI